MFKIGELSNMSNVSIKTIRFYEEEGLISPVEVDRWTNYRYYDETSIVRLSEIAYLKDLGLSLKEIKNLSEETIKQKIEKSKLDIAKLKLNIEKLSSIYKKEGELNMKNFVNDTRVIGKWKKLAIVDKKQDFALGKFNQDQDIFDFKEIYFLPNGEEYWVFSWTKEILYLKDRKLPYEIIDDKLYVGIVDYKSGNIDNYAVYEQVDNKQYKKQDIEIKDNIDIPFIKDEKSIGLWQVVDLVHKPEEFNPDKKQFKYEFFLASYNLEPTGRVVTTFNNGRVSAFSTWSKGVIICKNDFTVSEYQIKTLNGEDYMIVEWKSGDYVYGGEVRCYYCLKKIK